MAEYRIVASIDPSGVTQGKARIKQDLRDIDNSAASTKRSLNQAFSPQGVDVGGLVARVTALEGSLDKVAVAANRVAAGLEKTGRSGRGGAQGQHAMAAATRRVLQAVDQEAAELMRLNQLLEEARMLHARGAITADQFARVQTMVTNGIRQQVPSLQQQRAGYMMAGQQMQDWTQQLSLGVNPLVVLAQQGGQTASALQMAWGPTGTAGRVAGFIAGPWGSLMLAGVTILGMIGLKALSTGENVETLTEGLRKDAREAEMTAEAQRAFGSTLDGVSDALRRNKQALEDLDDQQKTAARRALENAVMAQIRLRGIRAETAALVDQAQSLLEIERIRSGSTAFSAEQAIAEERRVEDAQRNLDRQREALARVDEDIAEAQRQIQDALSRRVVELVDRDEVERIRDRYDGLIERARERALAEGTVSTELARQVRLLRDQRDAEIRRAQDRERESRRRQSDGVPRFRTRQQAIGIAGRELQRSGLRVGENEQFGGVQGNHPGMGNRAHGMFAIDVNATSRAQGDEANFPDIRARFDTLARRYQSRGYKVLWNGWVYDPGGSGPSRRIPPGQHQHRDHIHLEAPRTIVGRPTQGSAESAEITEEQRQARAAEQAQDFVDQVVDQAATRGLPTGQASQLASQLERTFADFRRRFDREVNPDERARITRALTDADARETSRRFDEAYVEPLRRLEQVSGTTGIAREILNAQIEEAIRLGRDLTPIEKELIESSIRHTDSLERQAEILEDVRAPLEEYRATMEALVALLQRGEISQAQFNARVSDMASGARRLLGDMPGVDPATGREWSNLADQAEERDRFAQELADFETNREALLAIGINYDALVEAAHRRHVDNMNAIDRARHTTALTAAQQTSESLLTIAEASVGKQSAVYKALFVASKAFAIAEAVIKIQQGIANALSLPFPANLAAVAGVAAAAASIVSNIQAVSLNLADGGLVRGPGGPRDDRIPAYLSNGEFVVNADATRSNRALLEAINSGRRPPPSPAGTVGGRMVVNLNNFAPGVEHEVVQVSAHEVEVIARKVVAKDAEKAVAGALANPNSRVSKALGRTTSARRRRR